MNLTVPEATTGRIASLDVLRTGLVAWIIGGHALLGYAAVGGWAYDEVNEVTLARPVETALGAFVGPTALFLMGTFFLVSGLFTAQSLDRKGRARFTIDRTLRLGVPFAVSVLALWPLCMWVAYWAAGEQVTYGWLLTGRDRVLDSGALWFAEVLLIFSLAYALVSLLAPHRPRHAAEGTLSLRVLLLFVVAITVTTYLLRICVPARSTQPLDLHLWQWPQLAAMFALGILGARLGLARLVPTGVWRTSGVIVLVTLVTIPPIAVGLGVRSLDGDLAAFLGGGTPQSLLMATVEAILVVFGSVWLLGFAQRAFSGESRFMRAVARGSFLAFALQGPVLILLAVAFRPLEVPAEVKAVAVGALGIVLCFALGWFVCTRTRVGRVM
ncbi:acyltransferase [Spiractinospora alimapuensis]|uniref:acyltransferase family protein n=1 Tax=Spiractinospora alimapuensis TaxID=2820884 RepID=UPI001F42D7E1|nr:acyltransferase [Spiractinospora alimapuensis]QVQ54268.1 acyltransferase [Spiractinospora alimapuensis]